MDFELPKTFAELLAKTATDAAFLGFIAAVLMGGFIKLLQFIKKDDSYALPERWNRLVSNGFPFVLAFVALGIQVWRGEVTTVNEETIYATITVSLNAIGGKHLIYTLWRLVKPSNEDERQERVLAVKAAQEKAEKAAETPPLEITRHTP